MKQCSVPGCAITPTKYKALCTAHYKRWARNGAPDAVKLYRLKFTDADIRAMLARRAAGESRRSVAEAYGISVSFLCRIEFGTDERTAALARPCDYPGCTEPRLHGSLLCLTHRPPLVPTHTPTKNPDKCIARGCNRYVRGTRQRGLCWAHYMRWYRTGTPYGVGRRGNPRPATKLTDEQVRAIRQAFQQGATALQLAQEYPVSIHHVYNLVEGRSRKDVV